MKSNDIEVLSEYYICCSSCDEPMEYEFYMGRYVYKCNNKDCEANDT